MPSLCEAPPARAVPTPKLSLMPWAIEFVLAIEPFLCLFAGRGAGKTHAIQSRMKWRSTRFAKLRIMYISPLSHQGRAVYLEMIADPEFFKFVLKADDRNHPTIYLKNGSQIVFRSFQRADNLRSTGEDEIYIDESQDRVFSEFNFDTCIMPLLGRRQSPAGGRGVLIFSGQFRGDDWRKNRFWNFGMPTMEDGSASPLYRPRVYRSWAVHSSQGYSFLTPGGPERLALIEEATPKKVWEQEWACVPCSNQAAAFPSDEIDDICKRRAWQVNGDGRFRNAVQREPRSGQACVASVDIGRIVDPTAIIIGDAAGNVLYEEEFSLGQPHEVSARRSVAIAVRYGCADMIVDATGGGMKSEMDTDAFVRLYKAECDAAHITLHKFYQERYNKRRIIENLGIAIQRKNLALPEGCVKTTRQLKAYEYVLNHKNGFYVFRGPIGTHDDFVSALAMYCEAIMRGWCNQRSSGQGYFGAQG